MHTLHQMCMPGIHDGPAPGAGTGLATLGRGRKMLMRRLAPGTNSSGTSSVIFPASNASSYTRRPCTSHGAKQVDSTRQHERPIYQIPRHPYTVGAASTHDRSSPTRKRRARVELQSRCAGHGHSREASRVSKCARVLRQSTCGSSRVSTARFKVEPRASRHCWL
jgi:hypothetical protein